MHGYFFVFAMHIMSSPHPLKFIHANGIDFAYHEAGNGPLVLCLHGFPDTARSFDHLLSTLAAAGYRAVAPYMRGYAPTACAQDGDYSSPTLGRDVLALIHALGAQEADVIGHDWGAYAAYCASNLISDEMLVAHQRGVHRQGSRVRRLVLMSVPHIGGARQSLQQLRRSWYIWFFQLSGLPERRVARDHFAFIDRLYRVWSPAWHLNAADLAPIKHALAAPGGLAATIGYYRAMFRHSSAKTWALLTAQTCAPTLMLAGAEDGAVGAEVFPDSAKAFSGEFEFQQIPKVGHFPHREAVEETEALILDFLSRPTLPSQAQP